MRGEKNKMKMLDFMGLANEYEKIASRQPKAINENCSKMLKMIEVNALIVKRFFMRMNDIFIIKKKKDIINIFVPKAICLFDNKNKKRVLKTSIMDIM